jgi:hypothetical protein
MMLVAIVASFAIAYVAHRGITGSTAVNIAINVIQISALIVFSVMALGYRITTVRLRVPGISVIDSSPRI